MTPAGQRWAAGLGLAALLAFARPAGADARLPPVVLESPGCEHEKLGSRDVRVGQRVDASTRERVPTTSYRRAFEALQEQARDGGADAVVLRRHQAVFFSMNGRRSSAPVYIEVSGGLIRMADSGACNLKPVDPARLQRAARDGTPDEVDAYETFGGRGS